MYCQQCQEAKSPACTSGGVCRKNAVISAYQDAVLFTLSGLAYRLESADKSMEPCVLEALFSTQTNTGFDKNRFLSYLVCITSHKDALPTVPGEPAACAWTPKSEEEIVTSGLTGLDTIEDVNTRSLYYLLLLFLEKPTRRFCRSSQKHSLPDSRTWISRKGSALFWNAERSV